MKRKKKLLILAIGLLLLAGLLSGCKKETAESLIKETVVNMNKANSLSGNLGMEMEVGMEQSGMSMDLNAKINMDMEVTNKPAAMHLNGTAEMDTLGLSLDLESYLVEEDGKNVTYTKTGDQWKKTESEQKETDREELSDLFSGIEKEKLVLQEKTAKVNDKEVYVIKTNIAGEDFEKIEENMKSYLEKAKLGEADLSKLSIDVTFKIYKDTKLPAAISFQVVDGMNELLESLAGESEMNLTMDKCAVDITFEEYNKVKEIKVPKEAKNAEKASDLKDVSDNL